MPSAAGEVVKIVSDAVVQFTAMRSANAALALIRRLLRIVSLTVIVLLGLVAGAAVVDFASKQADLRIHIGSWWLIYRGGNHLLLLKPDGTRIDLQYILYPCIGFFCIGLVGLLLTVRHRAKKAGRQPPFHTNRPQWEKVLFAVIFVAMGTVAGIIIFYTH